MRLIGKSYALLVLGMLAAVLLAVAGPAVAQQHAAHPLDALTGAEIGRTVEILRQAGHVQDGTLFPEFRLEEPAKKDVLAWKPGMPFARKAFVVMRRGGRVFEASIDIDAGKVIAHKEVGGVQPSIMQGEWARARVLTKADKRWQEAMRKRGYTTFDKISCAPLLPGHFPGDPTDANRLLKVPCFDDANPVSGLFGRPIEGVMAIIDVDADAVIDILDTGVVQPPKTKKPAGRVLREPMKPVLNLSPQGRNYDIKPGWKVNWQNWSFHLRIERRAGPVFSLVKFKAGKAEPKLIAYQMALAEMFVPYMHPGADWAFRTPMDTGEHGAGYTASSLRPGHDCPFQSTFINIAIPSDKGGQFPVERGLCIFERDTAEPLWRHGEPGTKRVRSRPSVELVVRMVTVVGNYDYVLDWVFSLNGNIKTRVGAAGFVAVKTVKEARAPKKPPEGELRFGTLVAPGALAVNHDHFFSFRIDLDVNGTNNTFVREVITPKAVSEGKRRSLWVVESEPLAMEGPIKPKGRHEVWRVINTNSRTELGHRPSIQLEPGHTIPSILSPDDPPQARAAFSAHPLWVSAHKPAERYAAGAYPNQSKGGEGLPAYVGDKESVDNKDLVLWYTIGFHHVPRAEDWPIMPTKWHEFTLRPFNFFDENPSMDLAPDFKKAQ